MDPSSWLVPSSKPTMTTVAVPSSANTDQPVSPSARPKRALTTSGQPSAPQHGQYTLTPNDIVIGVMGLTGSGKSTLISTLTGQDIPVGHNLKSCTSKVDIYATTYQNQAIFFIDTPGFDDKFRSDTEVLKDVAFFLSTIYAQKIKLAGMVYLHRITDPKMGGSALKNLHMFEKLCGKDSLKNIVLATTMWEKLDRDGFGVEVGAQRERELLENEEFWGFMASRGSRVMRHDGRRESAWNMVTYLIAKQNTVVLDIQREMVDEKQTLDNTSAGQAVQEELLKLQRKHQRDLQDLHEGLEYALEEKDQEMAEHMRRQQREYEAKIEQAARDREELKTDLESLIEDHKKQSERRIREIEKDRSRLDEQLHRKMSEVAQITSRLSSMERMIQRKELEFQSQMSEMMDKHTKNAEEERRRVERILFERDAALQEEREYAQMTRDRDRELKAAMEREIAHDEALNKRKGMTVSIIQTLAGTVVTGFGMYSGNTTMAVAGLGLARRAAFGN